MLDRIGILQMARQLAEHSAARQSVVARNIAHADTPGYRQQDIPDFSEIYRSAGTGMRATRSGHVNHTETGGRGKPFVVDGGPVAPNGNTVSLEDQILESAEIQQKHDMALAIYRSGLGVLRASLGRR
ncbi:FlgB family protein [Tropicimonas sp. IMCC6043]|uniref:FlgB family protein n=1 Tax=Tropicimonas sp. IMCC6043 TaxID=2510645 RepID=UPI00101D938D|nr:FlgB family protein [Tropicimonas sp. IMCC6043]RYH07492.1 FlgB family protein [Tropicimonas sp. IMCC6043]